MTDLMDMLYVYANENLTVHFQQNSMAETRIAQREAEELSGRLTALSPDAETYLEQLKAAWDTISYHHTRAIFLSGLSIGLKLGRL